jgi:spore photoproduct lyase
MKNPLVDLEYLLNRYSFSHGERENLKLWLGDLTMWGVADLADWWSPPPDKLKGKDLRQAALKPIRERWEREKKAGPDWSDSHLSSYGNENSSIVFQEITDNRNIMGACPVASKKTRCCNLQTLDAVFRCGFDCSYCSIQSFYSQGKISFHGNLREKLARLNFDENRIYHLGTGQSSDSLMWGNYQVGSGQGLLDELMRFARHNPRVILELKSKSSNIAWLKENRELIPYNVLLTWSLNPSRVISHEERLTATLDKRLKAAREMADLGVAVGFHFHPMIIYKGWQKEYGDLFSRVQEMFDPEEVVQVSFGTLTYIKPVLKKIRNRDFDSQILRMPLEESAGKYTYPRDLKEKLFTHAYRCFKSWHKSDVYFYLCMEDTELWQPVFGKKYDNNEDFENDMLSVYHEKLKSISTDFSGRSK